MTTKVNYDANTGIVLGYYPNGVLYTNIPEPVIEITDEDHMNSLGKTMQVVDGAFSEVVPSDAELLANAKSTKIAEIKTARDILIVSDITTSKGLVFSADESSQFRIYVAFKEWDGLLTAQGLDPATAQYPWGSTGLITKADLGEAYLLIQQRLAKVCGVLVPQLEAEVSACASVDDVLDSKGKVKAQGVNSIEVKFL